MDRTSVPATMVAGSVAAVLPAVGAFLIGSLVADGPVLWLLVVAWVVFGGLLASQPSVRAVAGATCLWLAVELLLAPFGLMVLLYEGAQWTDWTVESYGFLFGTSVAIDLAFWVGYPLALVLFVLSRSFATEGVEEGRRQADTPDGS